MKTRLTAIAALCCATLASVSYAETIWQENFDSVDGKGATGSTDGVSIDLDGVTGWTIDVSNAALTATSDYFRVQNNRLEGQDLDGEAIWKTTTPIDISDKGNIAIQLIAGEDGDHESADYIDVLYSIDGGDFIRIANWQGLGSASRTLVGDIPDDGDWGEQQIDYPIGSGSTLQIQIGLANNAGSETLYLDNITVATTDQDGGGNGGEDDGEGEGEGEDNADVCLNCPELDKVADAATFVDADYYAPVITEIDAGSSASMIKQALTEVITTDQRTLTYSQVWTALTESDEDPNNSDNVSLIYKGVSIPKNQNASAEQSGEDDFWNREHVWPSSRGFSDDSSPSDLPEFEAYTDIHHLRPSDRTVNQSRGNLNFDNSDDALSEAPLNRVDDDSFEPRDEVKGDVARMMFYMDTRYEGVGSENTPDLQLVDSIAQSGAQLGRLCRLIEWHNGDPVSDVEIARNNTIYEYQGNRNPFIDHPEWATLFFNTDACTDDDGEDGGEDGGDDGNGDTPVSSGLIFISEYIEGSSNNKALELFNPTGNNIDLGAGNYALNRFSNGGSNGTAINLTGVIAAGGTFVIVNSQANATFKGFANMESGSLSHNGDDAYTLTADGVVIDSFGQVGFDPGSAWVANGVTTVNATLVRKASVASGDIVFDDAFDPSVEWNGFATDNTSDLGKHTFTQPELYISEYIEGSSNNKALEIYNPASSSVDLAEAGYRLERYSNGSSSGTNIALTGTVAGLDVYVIANNQSVDAIKDVADQLSGSVNHNGDDAYILFKGDEVIDSFGQVGFDPGSAWSANGVTTVNSTLIRKDEIVSGDTISDDVFDPSLEWDGLATDTFENLGSHKSSSDDDGGDNGGGDAPELGQCSDVATPIYTIQGSEEASTMVGETVVVEAVVTGSYDGLGGFFLQEAVGDAMTVTSDGIFVNYTADGSLPIAGQLVRVLGEVAENFGRTQINVPSALVDCGATDAIVATGFDLPFTSIAEAESLEGMLVINNSPLTVSDHFNLGRFGQVSLSSKRLFIPTNLYAPLSSEALALADENALNVVIMDDGLTIQNPDPVAFPAGGLSASNTLRTGDLVTSLSGPLDYSFGDYRIHPAAPTIVGENARETSPSITRGNLVVASLNVLNLFNGDGMGSGFPTPRGAHSLAEYDRQLAKTVSAIVAMDADVVGLMEIENDGFGANSMIQQLTDALNDVMGEGTYAFVASDGAIGTDEIAVGFLYKPSSVTLSGEVQLNFDSIFNRPPMAQTFALDNGAQVVIAVNHFKSKGCSGSSGLDADQNDGQACYNDRRTQQSQTLAAWIASNEALNQTDNVLIIGDLNAYAKEDPIKVLEDGGYTNLVSLFAGADAYSYTFGGEFGNLDHALANAALTEQVVDAIDWHINSDEPRVLDYNVEFKSDAQLVDFYAPDAFRMSDHDPVMMSFNLVPVQALVTDFDDDGDVDSRDVRAFTLLLRAEQATLINHDYNLDGVLDTLDVGALRELCTRARCSTRDIVRRSR